MALLNLTTAKREPLKTCFGQRVDGILEKSTWFSEVGPALRPFGPTAMGAGGKGSFALALLVGPKALHVFT